MALDLEEQEQVDELKAWWKQHGNKVTMLLAVFVLSVVGWNGWQSYQARQSNEASALFDVLRKELSTNNVKGIRGVAGQIIDKYPRTPYAVDAAMFVAKANFESRRLQKCQGAISVGDRSCQARSIQRSCAHAFSRCTGG